MYAGCENESKIPGDSDIAGVGVMIAFIVPAWVTIGAATIASLSVNLKGIGYRFALGAEDLLGPLCDLQAITGAAIVVAGFSQWNTITFYHREMVLAYWWLTSNSFWITWRAYMYEAVKDLDPTSDTTSWTKWRVYIRRLLIVVSVFLGIVWAASSILLETDHWNEEDPQNCYHFNDVTYTEEAMPLSWVWVAGLIIYESTLIWSFLDQQGNFSDTWKRWGKKSESYFEKPGDDCSKEAANISSLQLLFWRFATFASWIMFRFVWLSRMLISVWPYGDSDVRGFHFFYYVLTGSNTWDIITLKVVNGPLVEDETKIGYGQVMPLVLLLQIPLSILDIWKSPIKQKERADRAAKAVATRAKTRDEETEGREVPGGGDGSGTVGTHSF